ISEVGDATVVMGDLCLDEFTSHGHCGVLGPDGSVDNDATLAVYGDMAVAQARAGAHMLGLSGMMDGPVREAVESSLQGDRMTYQQDGANAREAIREATLDLAEGADIVMVKPAGP